MKKRCAFTICTRSYIGLARALQKSFIKHNPEYDFYIILADYEESFTNDAYVLDSKIIMAVEDELYLKMAFQYNITEFCTSIKPFAFKWAFRNHYELSIYLDPDILVFSEFEEVGDGHSIYLTPHILDMNPNAFGHWKEPELMICGVYNCGFIAIRNDLIGIEITNWWSEKLKNGAFSDIESGMYTDQKWIDMVFCFTDINRIKIIKNLGYNVAPWNFHERQAILQDNKYQIVLREKCGKSDDLVFLHFSGYHYNKLIKDNTIESNYVSRFKYDDYDELVGYYRKQLIASDTYKFLDIKYGHGFYKNGVFITDFNRRIYRACTEKGEQFENPFATKEGSFYNVLLESNLISKMQSTKEIKGSIGKRDKKEKELISLFKLVFRILGCDKYYYFIWKVHEMTKIEKSLFLLDSKK